MDDRHSHFHIQHNQGKMTEITEVRNITPQRKNEKKSVYGRADSSPEGYQAIFGSKLYWSILGRGGNSS